MNEDPKKNEARYRALLARLDEKLTHALSHAPNAGHTTVSLDADELHVALDACVELGLNLVSRKNPEGRKPWEEYT